MLMIFTVLGIRFSLLLLFLCGVHSNCLVHADENKGV